LTETHDEALISNKNQDMHFLLRQEFENKDEGRDTDTNIQTGMKRKTRKVGKRIK